MWHLIVMFYFKLNKTSEIDAKETTGGQQLHKFLCSKVKGRESDEGLKERGEEKEEISKMALGD